MCPAFHNRPQFPPRTPESWFCVHETRDRRQERLRLQASKKKNNEVDFDLSTSITTNKDS